MENRKGNGIFLGVVSVATLVVAIIGATFAYFSASTNSADDAVNLTAYEFNAGLSVEYLAPTSAAALIPLDADATVTNTEVNHLTYALNEATNRCLDENNYQVCALYRVTITNNGSSPLVLSGTIKTVANQAGSGNSTGADAFKDLHYQLVTGDHENDETGLTLSGTPVALATTEGESVAFGTSAITVPAATTAEVDGETKTTAGTYSTYVVVYLNENGDQSTQMGAKFKGQFVYSTGGANSNQLTGTFTVAAPEEQG